MDTSVKKYKYSLPCKAVCIVLCLLTAMSACLITMAGAYTLSFNSVNKKDADWTETNAFESRLSWAVGGIVNYTFNGDNPNKLEKELNSLKDAAVSAVYEEFNSIIFEKYDSVTDETEIYCPDLLFDTLTFTVNTDDFGEHEFQYYNDDYILFGDIYEDIAARYDEFVDEEKSNYECNYIDIYDSEYINSVNFSIEKDGKVENTNLANFDKSNIKNEAMYLVIENNKIKESSGISENTLANIISNIESDFKGSEYTLYVYIDLDENNWFLFDKCIFNMCQWVNNYFYQLLAADILCIVASFCLAFYYFQVTGRKNKDDPAKLWFADYVPFEVQTAAVGGLGFGAFVLFFTVVDRLYNFQLCVLIYIALCFACWLMLFMLASSVSRYINSDRKFYRHLSTYWVFLAIFKALAFIFKGIVKLFKRMRASAKKTSGLLKYKPQHFKRNVILLTILYFVVNLILVLVIVAFFAGAPPLGFIAFIGDLAGNIVIVNKVLKYVKYLDMIITASSQHTDIEADLSTLPESLRVLAESMKYTNTELQQAVNKAVKDERLRTELITNVSHDLKTPLTSIITYVDLLSKCDINDERAREYIAVLDEKGAKLKRLIDDLIEASKVTSGNITVNSAPMNLSELCLQATVDAQPDFEKAGLDLIIKQGELPTNVFADGAKTFRIIENLLSNARKYSAKASRVYVSVYDEDNKGVFEIKNMSAQPLDISPDELTERFVRGDKSRNQEGNGLGLSIAKELCRAQGGNLEITIDGDLFKAKVKLPKS